MYLTVVRARPCACATEDDITAQANPFARGPVLKKDYLRPREGGCSLTVDVSPGASRTEVSGVNEWRGALQVKVAAEPREGAANEELVRFLSELLGVPKRGIEIERGATSSLKVISLPIDAATARARLGGG